MLRLSIARPHRVAPKSMHTLVHQLLAVQNSSGRTLMSAMGPKCFSKQGMLLMSAANCMCFLTYCIMTNWIYEGYVDLWYGVYGVEDDDDDDD
ncbi:hypothetical protein ABL78_1384 [Leptomonas seymouri]|uniref:Uncharacterized protein n=1 Tax=Leptomonas seymouri TaxID=5684 RepID=A0A0N1PF04_LEPSE|nr:hypothetical protein ABL78_1384 [Leptomonas seymouri]|eukprot:KPI89508.1 hypothetical protein ABL78_1384 [Leptomonas seymouri]